MVAAPWQMLSMIMEKNDFLRPNRYIMQLEPPKSMAAVDSKTLERVCHMCRRAQLPGRSYATKEVEYGGSLIRKIPHSVIYHELPLEFYSSEDLAEKRFFDEWQESIADQDTQRLSYYETYASSLLQVTPLTGSNALGQYRYDFYECWPLDVSPIEMAYDLDNQVAVFQVSMAYYKWKREPTKER